MVALFLVAAAALIASPARAEFNGGVEQFNGTTFDAVTWERFPTSGVPNAFVQSNALTITANGSPGTSTVSDATTQTITVGVGQGVRTSIDVQQLLGVGGTGSLYLTNDSLGTSSSVENDSIALEVFSQTSGLGYMIWQDGNGSGQLFPPASSIGTFTFENERLAIDSARFAAYDSGNNLIGSIHAGAERHSGGPVHRAARARGHFDIRQRHDHA